MNLYIYSSRGGFMPITATLRNSWNAFYTFCRNTFMTYLMCSEENVWIHFTQSLNDITPDFWVQMSKLTQRQQKG